MSSGLQVFGPDGSIWLDTNDKTSRVMGVLAFTSAFTVTTITFPCPAGTNPWVGASASNGLDISATVANNGNGTANMAYAMGYGANSSWPPNGQIHIVYGYA